VASEETDKFLKVWYGEIAERLVRAYHYVCQQLVDAPSRQGSPSILLKLRQDIELAAEMFRNRARQVLEEERIGVDPTSYYTEARRQCKRFTELHRRLSYVPTPWAQPELEHFLLGVAAEKDHPYAITLSGEFNFASVFIAEGVGDVGSRGYGEAQNSLRNVLSVPVAEQLNVVMWPNLIHEMGHFLASDYGIVQQAMQLDVVKRLGKTDPLAMLTLQRNWMGEIVADLIATDLLGLGYYVSFSNFSSYWSYFVLHKNTEKHPSPDIRNRYILERLKRHDQKPDYAIEKWENQMCWAWNCRKELDFQLEKGFFEDLGPGTGREKVPSNDVVKVPPDEVVLELASAIPTLGCYQRIREHQHDFDLDMIRGLQTRIGKSEFIGTSRKRSEEARPEGEKQFEYDVAQLVEYPNRIVDIVNAAILQRLGIHFLVSVPDIGHGGLRDELLKELCGDSSRDIKEVMPRLWQSVVHEDAVVLKSIETRAICDFYQTKAQAVSAGGE